jgi:hypothetical protein
MFGSKVVGLKWEDNIKGIINKWRMEVWYEFIWLTIRTSGLRL